MPTFVPSQVCEFLDERMPAARQQVKGAATDVSFPPEYAGALAHLLAMLDGIPPHLLTLKAKAAAELGEAKETIRITLDTWRAGNRTLSVGPLVAKNGRNPVTMILHHLENLPDEGAGARSSDLEFIVDEQFRASLASDLFSIDAALDRGAWKAATVLSGSVTEALLLDALMSRAEEAPAAGAAVALSWTLHQLTEEADKRSLLKKETVAQCRLAKDFRNLIHPGRSIRLGQQCDRGTAFAGVAAVEHVIRDLRSPR